MHLGKLKMLKSLILPDHLCCWKFFCVVFPFLTFESEALYFLKNVVPNGAPRDVAIFSVSKKQFTFAENLTWMDGSVGNFAPRELVSCDPGFYKEEKSRPCKPCPTGHRCLGGAGGSSGKFQAMLYPSCVLKNHGARMFWLLYNYFETSPNSAAYWEEKSTAAIVQEVLLPIRPPVPIALNVQKAISQHMLALWTAIRVLQVMKV